MNYKTIIPILIGFNLFFLQSSIAQEGENPFGNKPLKWSLNEKNTRWIGLHTYLQLWARVNENNPGSIISEEIQNTTTDISIRRFRLAVQSQITEKLFAYTQLGINNLNYLSPRGTSLDLLDAYIEYDLFPQLSIGAGKTAWTGLSRYSAPNTSKLLSYDLLFLALPTNDETNDLIRKLSLYTKGKLGKLDYRLVVSKPFSARNSEDFDETPQEHIAKFTDQGSGGSYSGYVKWEFKDRESNKIPFSDGTYLGKKSVLNVGAGIEYQPDALWYLENGEVTFSDMKLWAIDFFLDQPINPKKNTVLTFYTGYFNYDFGPNYLKNIGANNPATSLDPIESSFNGPGNAFPAVGTGDSFFVQAGYLFSYMGKPDKKSQLQSYFSIQYSDFEQLEDPMIYYDLGLNWLFNGHLSKLSLNFQNRPVFTETINGIEFDDRKWMAILQYIIRLE